MSQFFEFWSSYILMFWILNWDIIINEIPVQKRIVLQFCREARYVPREQKIVNKEEQKDLINSWELGRLSYSLFLFTLFRFAKHIVVDLKSFETTKFALLTPSKMLTEAEISKKALFYSLHFIHLFYENAVTVKIRRATFFNFSRGSTPGFKILRVHH